MTKKPIAILLGGALGVIAASLVLAVALNDGGTAEAQAPPATYWKVSMPDLGQHSDGWCWAGAAADSFWWFADNLPGQEGLLGGVGSALEEHRRRTATNPATRLLVRCARRAAARGDARSRSPATRPS